MPVVLYKHNQETYKNIIEMFKTQKRVGVVQPTGTGKSFLMLKWMEDNVKDDITVLSPSIEIFNQLKRYAAEMNVCIDNKVSFISYEKLNTMEESEVLSLKADKIILDEFHRAGAEQWGKSIELLLNNNAAAQVLGLTATPVRYLDEARNMADELFYGCLAKEMTLGEAVAEGILPIPQYVPVWYDYDGRIADYQEDIAAVKNRKKRKEVEDTLIFLKRQLENSYGAKDIFRANMPTNHGKWIVFCKDTEQVDEIISVMKDWLSEVNSDIHSYVSVAKRNDKEKQLRAFMDDNDKTAVKLLYTVDRFNEGVHIDNIDGVIMLRPTKSPIIYLQQMGRALSSKGTRRPIIFDIVNNYQNVMIDYGNGKVNVFEKEFYDSIPRKKHLEFRIFEDMKHFLDILNEIEHLLNNVRPWTVEEINILKDNYIKNKGIASFAHLLPHRSRGSILSMAKRLGLTAGAHQNWSAEELEFLRKNYVPGRGTKELESMLRGRSRTSILAMARRMGLTDGRKSMVWTKDEDDTILTHYNSNRQFVYTKLSNRSKNSIQTRASLLGITSSPIIRTSGKDSAPWTHNEITLLIEKYYTGISIDDLQPLFPDKSIRSIRRRITKLGLSQRKKSPTRKIWTTEEKKTIINLYREGCTSTEIVSHLPARSLYAVKTQIRKMKKTGEIKQ